VPRAPAGAHRRSAGAHRAAPATPASSHRAPVAAHRRRPPTARWARRAAGAVGAGVTGTLAAMGIFALLGIGPLHTDTVHADASAQHTPTADPTTPLRTGAATGTPTPSPTPSVTTAAAALPLGPATLATIPRHTSQVVVVEGRTTTSDTARVALYQRTGTGWRRTASWSGHIGKEGWTTHHVQGDLRSPVGTFTLTAAGGRSADPGSGLPYFRSSAYVAPASGPGFGDTSSDVFDYVLAIDYNRVPGSSPLDMTRPLGAARGGGIWIHVDHGGPTHGCVSIPKAAVRTLITRLTTSDHPVVVMGDAATLAR